MCSNVCDDFSDFEVYSLLQIKKTWPEICKRFEHQQSWGCSPSAGVLGRGGGPPGIAVDWLKIGLNDNLLFFSLDI